jgi:hypothetical protein
MECLGLHSKPKAEVHPGHLLTDPKEGGGGGGRGAGAGGEEEVSVLGGGVLQPGSPPLGVPCLPFTRECGKSKVPM